jgi:two-component system, OmpR family, osmolarity sensor histidine kinase EnvZ
MRLVPRTLLWRSFLLFAILIVCSQLIAIYIARLNEREPRAKQVAQQAVSIVNLSRTALIAVPRERRRYLLTELHRQEGIRIYPADTGAPVGRQAQRPFGKIMQREIIQRLGPETQVEFGRQGVPGLWVSFAIEDDTYWVALPRIQVGRSIPQQLILWVGVSILLALLGAWLIAWRINRPLKALAASAQSIGQGAQPAPLAEDGPQEVRTVIRSFNHMNQDLAQLNQERTVMLAGISHDLRTPLARLRLAVELQEGKTDEKHRQGMVQDIADLDAIIGQFLAFVRGTENESSESVDLNQLINATRERYTRSGKNLSLELGVLPILRLRPLAMQRLLSNLLDNAYRHGSQEVTLQTEHQGNRIRLSVLDRGPGIPPEQAASALQPFSRLNSARSGQSGAGLGLAIVDQIARMHGGTVALLPRQGGGLEVRVTLPA